MKAHISTLLISLFLTACQPQAEAPKQVAEKYWQALSTGDIETAEKLVSSSSQKSLQNYLALPDDEKISLDDIKHGHDYAVVETDIAIDAENEQRKNFNTVLVLQDGEWKIDASRTLTPVISKLDEAPLSEALQENLDSIDEAIEQGADLLNEFMQEGSKEMSDSLRKGMNKMNETLQEAIEKMRQRREQEKHENGEGLL